MGNKEHVPRVVVPGGSSSIPLRSFRVYQKAPRRALEHLRNSNGRKTDAMLMTNSFYRRTVEVAWNWP